MTEGQILVIIQWDWIRRICTSKMSDSKVLQTIQLTNLIQNIYLSYWNTDRGMACDYLMLGTKKKKKPSNSRVAARIRSKITLHSLEQSKCRPNSAFHVWRSQNHRMICVGRTLKDHTVSTPCCGEGHLPLDRLPVALSILASSIHLQQSFSGQSAQCLTTLIGKKDSCWKNGVTFLLFCDINSMRKVYWACALQNLTVFLEVCFGKIVIIQQLFSS